LTTQLSTYHDIRAIDIIRSYVAETGQFFGADEKEIQQLKLASEEAAGFIISALIPDKDENFNIVCEAIEQGLRFYFEIKGIPIDEENMPVYDSVNPTDSLDGLPFLLIESVTDAVKFQNKGNNGWELVFEKHFKTFQSLEVLNETDPEVLERCAKEKLPIVLATPEDAYDLIKLTYFTYRYSYAKEIFYYRKELQEAISTGRIIAFIGKNSEGEVVINSAFFRSPHCDAIAEAGMLMSRPEYRQNRALLRLTRMQLKYIQEGDSGIRVLYSKLVTAHTRSQRLLMAYRFLPTSLKLSIHDQADFVGLDTEEVGRESLLYALIAPNGFEPNTLYVPQKHQKMTEVLLENVEAIAISADSAELQETHTLGTVEIEEADRYATISIENLGQDWYKWLRDHLNACDNDGIITIHLHIPADNPLPEDFEAKLHSLDLFYSGVVMKTMQRWELVYTLLQGQYFDFDTVSLCETSALALHDYMKQEYMSLKSSE
jgi:anti-sigma regulatory factor (Ser/Thr protein kinase)